MGMSDKLGFLKYGTDRGEIFIAKQLGKTPDYSDKTARIIDKEKKRISDAACKRALEILNQKIKELHAIAKKFLEKDTLDGDEV